MGHLLSKQSASAPYLEIHINKEPSSPGEVPLHTTLNYETNSSDFISAIEESVQRMEGDIDDNKPLLHITFLTHGYMSFLRKDGEHFYEIKDAILTHGPLRHIVILVDWSALSGTSLIDYSIAVRNVKKLSTWLGAYVAAIRTRYKEGVHIHGIGFSLGAHLIGNAAEYADLELQLYCSNGLKAFDRITGLDPSGPAVVFKKGIFSLMGSETTKLRKDHAHMVDIIHTTDHLGTDKALGHIDWYPNWGQTQGKLPNLGYLNVTSHIYCLKLFLQSIQDKNRFTSVEQIKDLKNKEVEIVPEKEATMGYFCSPEARGLYFIEII